MADNLHLGRQAAGKLIRKLSHMTKRIFIWSAHPGVESLCGSLADAYQEGADRDGVEVRRMNLSEMSFDSDFAGYNNAMPPLEKDLKAWQQNIEWASHLLFVYPYWWGAMPAKAKTVLDRALISGFGFKYHKKGMGWDKLLKGRTADVIITSDTPPLIDTLFYKRPGRQVIKNQVLEFCGIKPKKIVQFGSVKTANHEKIRQWIAQAKRMGGKV
jgi:NAD(P)H dehydrogenase (quinone)